MASIEPMLAIAGPHRGTPPQLKIRGLAFEIKWDGVRCIARITPAGGVTMWSRTGRIINSEYPEIVQALELSVPVQRRPITLDGEIIWMHNGLPDRQRLQNRKSASPEERRKALRFMVFDCLQWEGQDLMGRRYDERRPYLFRLEPNPIVQISVSSPDGPKMWAMVEQFNLEGLIAKPVSSRYYPGKRSSWMKLKHNQRDVFQVVGYTSGEGTRTGLFGSLVLAKQVNGELLYGGKVGTGFTFQNARKLIDQMKPLAVDEPPIAKRDIPRAMQHITTRRSVTWIQPVLRAEVEFSDRSRDGIPLMPSFKGIATEK